MRAFHADLVAALLTLALHAAVLLACALAKEPVKSAAFYPESRIVLPPLRQDEAYTLAPSSDNVLGGSEPPARCAHEMTLYFVRPGETLRSIAKDHGLDDVRELYNLTLNPELVALHPDPEVVASGDMVRLPPPPGERYCEGQLAAAHELGYY